MESITDWAGRKLEAADVLVGIVEAGYLDDDATEDDLDRWVRDNGPLVTQREFPEYAQQLAEDCGMLPDNASWPLSCIDWEHAAHELAYDYASADIDGTVYLFQAY